MSRLLKRPKDFHRSTQAKLGRWYELKNIAADVAEVTIYDEIGAWGITASDFIAEMQGVTAKAINLHINSPGGDVWDGLAILNSLRQHPATVNVTIDGLAASAASFIAMAGDRVVMAPQSMLMIHEASGLVIGNSQDMADMAALLDKASSNIAQVYAQRAGGTVDDWRQAMKNETWYTDREAVDAGLADGVLGDDDPPTAKATPTISGRADAPAPVTDQRPAEPVREEPAEPVFQFDPDAFRRAFEEASAR